MNQRENDHTFFHQKSPSFTNLPEIKDNQSHEVASITDEKYPNEEILHPKGTQSSFHFMDYIQESPRGDKNPLTQAHNAFTYGNKPKKPTPLKSQKVKVASNPHLKDNIEPLSLNQILGQMESPMAPLNDGSSTKNDKNRAVPNIAGISNFWASSHDETHSYGRTCSPAGYQGKRGQVSDRWVVDTIGSEDDRTERLWKRQGGTQHKLRVFGEDLAREDDLYFQSHTERRREGEEPEGNQGIPGVSGQEQQNNRDQNPVQRYNARAIERSRRQQANQARESASPHPVSLQEQGYGQRNEVVEIGTGNIGESNDQHAPQGEEAHVDPEAVSLLDKQLLLKRCAAFYFALGLGFAVTLLSLFGFITPQLIFVVAFGYLVYFGIESGIRVYNNKREPWRKREEAFNACDAICGIFLLILIELRKADVTSWSLIGFGPFPITLLVYFICSRAPDRIKYRKIFLRFSYSFQVFFVTAKLDSIIDIDWRIAFGMVWICLGLIALYLVAYALMLVLAVIFGFIGQRLFDDIGMGLQFVGLVWYLMYYGLSVVGYLIILGVGEAYEDGNGFKTLKLASILGIVLNTVLVIYTIVAYEPLAKFLRAFNKIENTAQTVTSPLERRPLDKTVNLQVEKKESYFVMLSSTYFSPLKNTIFYKNEEKLKKIKNMVLGFRLWKPQTHYEESLQEVTLATPVDIKVLKEYKQDLDERFSRIAANQTHDDLATSRSIKSSRGKVPSQRIDTPVKVPHNHQHQMSFSDNNEAIKSRRLNLSADDVNFKEVVGNKESEPSMRQDNLCYLCYDSAPNAVLMHCGHGGICYSCASALVMKKNECMECRRPVEFIYKVDPNPKMKDIVKAVEICKVSLE